MTTEQQFTKNFNYLKSLKAKMLAKELLTEKENNQLLHAMTNGFAYASKPKNFIN
jgi:hypothetical protein